MALSGNCEHSSSSVFWKPAEGAEKESRVQAMKGPRCHTCKFQLFFPLGQKRAIGEF